MRRDRLVTIALQARHMLERSAGLRRDMLAAWNTRIVPPIAEHARDARLPMGLTLARYNTARIAMLEGIVAGERGDAIVTRALKAVGIIP